MTVRRIDIDLGDDRVETGAVQFGDDWPGLFIRGDDAMELMYCLQSAADVPCGLYQPTRRLLEQYANIIEFDVKVRGDEQE